MPISLLQRAEPKEIAICNFHDDNPNNYVEDYANCDNDCIHEDDRFADVVAFAAAVARENDDDDNNFEDDEDDNDDDDDYYDDADE